MNHYNLLNDYTFSLKKLKFQLSNSLVEYIWDWNWNKLLEKVFFKKNNTWFNLYRIHLFFVIVGILWNIHIEKCIYVCVYTHTHTHTQFNIAASQEVLPACLFTSLPFHLFPTIKKPIWFCDNYFLTFCYNFTTYVAFSEQTNSFCLFLMLCESNMACVLLSCFYQCYM